jgi:hypothetical protein
MSACSCRWPVVYVDLDGSVTPDLCARCMRTLRPPPVKLPLVIELWVGDVLVEQIHDPGVWVQLLAESIVKKKGRLC